MKTSLKTAVILAIFIAGAFLRLYKYNTPLADWHSWRQADTASVAREYLKHGIDLLHPKYMDLSNIPSGQDNPEGYRMVEFPLIPAAVAFLYEALPVKSLELHVFYRLTSIILSLGSAYFLWRLVSTLAGSTVGLFSLLYFLILPYNIFYSRVVLPEVALVFFSLLTMWSVVHAIRTNSNLTYVLGLITAAVALLLKPTAAFFFLPLIYYLWHKKGMKGFMSPKWLVVPLLAAIPFLVWRWWIARFPEGIPAYSWLLNGNNIRFKGAFFRWLFAERLGKLILGYWGLIPFAFGFLKKVPHQFFLVWLLSMALYLSIFATGNVQHDYYQIVLIPIIAVYLAFGSVFVLNLKQTSAPIRYTLLSLSVIFMLMFSWYEVRGYYNINNPAIITAGQAVDRLTPKDALVIAPYQGDTAFLYQTNRRGWPIGGAIAEKVSAGASYYVSTAYDDETASLATTSAVIEKTPEYTLIKLTP